MVLDNPCTARYNITYEIQHVHVRKIKHKYGTWKKFIDEIPGRPERRMLFNNL